MRRAGVLARLSPAGWRRYETDDGISLRKIPDDVGRRIIENLKVEVKFRVTSPTVGGYGVSAGESGRGASQM